MTDRPAETRPLHQLRAPVGDFVAEQALIIREQIEDPSVAKVRAQLDAWREQNT